MRTARSLRTRSRAPGSRRLTMASGISSLMLAIAFVCAISRLPEVRARERRPQVQLDIRTGAGEPSREHRRPSGGSSSVTTTRTRSCGRLLEAGHVGRACTLVIARSTTSRGVGRASPEAVPVMATAARRARSASRRTGGGLTNCPRVTLRGLQSLERDTDRPAEGLALRGSGDVPRARRRPALHLLNLRLQANVADTPDAGDPAVLDDRHRCRSVLRRAGA